MLAVRRYLQYGLSYRDVEELLAEHGIEVDRHCCVDGSTRDFDPCSRPQPGGPQHLLVLLMRFRTPIWGLRRTREATLWLNATVPFWVGDTEFFCPALDLGHDDEGALLTAFDQRGLEHFIDAATSGPRQEQP